MNPVFRELRPEEQAECLSLWATDRLRKSNGTYGGRIAAGFSA